MSTFKPTHQRYSRQLVEAAAWRAHLTEKRAETSADFEAWLALDSANLVAWRQVQSPWEFFGEQATSPELMDARRRALQQAQAMGRRRWRGPLFASASFKAALAASVVMITVVALIALNLNRADIYRTRAGERRTITLSDASTITLDAQTEVHVRYSDDARYLELLAGQARFDVAHNVARPFSVVAGGQKIVATGTAFDVDLLGPEVLVTLIEGHVIVVPESSVDPSSSAQISKALAPSKGDELPKARARGATRAGIELSAGEQLALSPGLAPAIASVNIERATAWQSGQLVFDNELLSSVVARLNRYSIRPIAIADNTVSNLRISGVFNSADTDGFISTLTHYLPIVAQESDGSIRLVHR